MRGASGQCGPAGGSGPPQPGTGATERQQRWARLRRSLWQPPRPHGEQPRERTVGSLELFYDLAVVVLVAQAARHLAGHLTWRGLGEFAAVFTLVWIAWGNGSLTMSCTATTTPVPGARSCCRSWCWSRWPPSSPRRAVRAARRSP